MKPEKMSTKSKIQEKAKGEEEYRKVIIWKRDET